MNPPNRIASQATRRSILRDLVHYKYGERGYALLLALDAEEDAMRLFHDQVEEQVKAVESRPVRWVFLHQGQQPEEGTAYALWKTDEEDPRYAIVLEGESHGPLPHHDPCEHIRWVQRDKGVRFISNPEQPRAHATILFSVASASIHMEVSHEDVPVFLAEGFLLYFETGSSVRRYVGYLDKG